MTARATIAAALIAAAMTIPADAQSFGDHRFQRTDDNRSLTVTSRGQIWFTDDDSDVARVEDGGRLMIEERRRGFPDRMLIITTGRSGRQERTYLVDGVRTEYDQRAEAWLATLIPELARESGIGAEERARRILDRDGPDGLIAEAERIRSSSVRRRYLTVLLDNGRPRDADTPRALRAVAGIGSSSEKATLLVLAANRVPLDDPATRAAYFDAVRSISSGSELRRVLMAVLDRTPVGAPVLAEGLDASRRISSGSERATVLVAVAGRHRLASGPVRDAFFTAADEMSSSSERRRVLIAVLRAPGSDEAVVRAVVRSARSIASDSEKAAVLLEASSRSVPPS